MTEYRVGAISNFSKNEFALDVSMRLSTRFSGFEISEDQQLAWITSAHWVWLAAKDLAPTHSECLFYFEFSPAFITQRSDFMFISDSAVVVFEAKTGTSHNLNAAKKQALKYARDIYNYIDAGLKKEVVACVIQESGKGKTPSKVSQYSFEPIIENVVVLGHNELSRYLGTFSSAHNADDLSPKNWLYHPRPSIVEAAAIMFDGVQDSDLLAYLAEDEEIEDLTIFVTKVIQRAQENQEHVVVAVSGVPGAGKTLVGLKLAHEKQIQEILGPDSPAPIYLSGNGPLVQVLTEVLARNEVERTKCKIGRAREISSTKIRLVHAITKEGFPSSTRVVIFDEAQRAWNQKQMRRKHGKQDTASEAEELLTHLERVPWSVVVCLVGTGQNINDGEEGIVTWIAAVKNRNQAAQTNWKIKLAPSEFSNPTDESHEVVPSLFMSVVRRAENASSLGEWVDALLQRDTQNAAALRQKFKNFPLKVTRDQQVMKAWLRATVRMNFETYGLVASSRSGRLPLYGIDPKASAASDHDWTQWFLDRPPNLNSALNLEIAATEFKCQGLELDRVGVCWSWDFVPLKEGWLTRKLNPGLGKWVANNKSEFALNTYRVLLTRARYGMVIWVPEGSGKDQTRNPEEMDKVFELLVESGCDVLP